MGDQCGDGESLLKKPTSSDSVPVTPGVNITSTSAPKYSTPNSFNFFAASSLGASTSLFGGAPKMSSEPETGLFGSLTKKPSEPATNLFAKNLSKNSSEPATGLFGSLSRNSSEPATGLFANLSKNSFKPTTGLFANNLSKNSSEPATGLFGKPTTSASLATPSIPALSHLTSTSPPKQSTTLFCNASKTSTKPPSVDSASSSPYNLFGFVEGSKTSSKACLKGPSKESASLPPDPFNAWRSKSPSPGDVHPTTPSFVFGNIPGNALEVPVKSVNGLFGPSTASIPMSSSLPEAPPKQPASTSLFGATPRFPDLPTASSNMFSNPPGVPMKPSSTSLFGPPPSLFAVASRPLPSQPSIFKSPEARSQLPFIKSEPGSSQPTSNLLGEPSSKAIPFGSLTHFRSMGLKRSASVSSELRNLESKKAKKSVEFSGSESIVTVIAGREHLTRPFAVHKSLLPQHSLIFENALAGYSSNQGEHQTIVLEDIDSAAFGLFVHWLYSQDLNGHGAASALLLAKLWVLAERFGMPGLQNEALTKFQESLNLCDKWDDKIQVIQYVYEEEDLAQEHPLRKITVEMLAYGFGKRRGWHKRFNRFPKEFMADVMMVLFTFHDAQKSKGIPVQASRLFVRP